MTTDRSARILIGQNIDQIKAEVKAELDGPDRAALAEPRGQVRVRLQTALRRIGELVDETAPLSQVRCFVFVISALIHHERHGGLNEKQILRLGNVANVLLQNLGINPQRSKLGFLYDEMHLALSQVFRREGRHLEAAWEQEQSHQGATPGFERLSAFQELAVANRRLRLGHCDFAITGFLGVMGAECTNEQRFRAQLGLARAWRLSGQRNKARELVETVLAQGQGSGRLRSEFEWESICLAALEEGQLDAMIKAIGKQGRLRGSEFTVEALFWAWCCPQRYWSSKLERYATPHNLGSRKGYFRQCAMVLASCHDRALPLESRLPKLRECLAESHRLVAVDRELLLWLAAARWLAQIRSVNLAGLALREYESLSLRLSRGANRDVLGLGGDLMERSWFQHHAAA